MPQHDVVVIGGSAGALQPLTTIIESLPVGLAAAVLVVIHTRSETNGMLPQLLARGSKLPVAYAEHDAKDCNPDAFTSRRQICTCWSRPRGSGSHTARVKTDSVQPSIRCSEPRAANSNAALCRC
jgi:hypothetical protein